MQERNHNNHVRQAPLPHFKELTNRDRGQATSLAAKGKSQARLWPECLCCKAPRRQGRDSRPCLPAPPDAPALVSWPHPLTPAVAQGFREPSTFLAAVSGHPVPVPYPCCFLPLLWFHDVAVLSSCEHLFTLVSVPSTELCTYRMTVK